jgi:Fe-Mn family superoxide dismutase
MFTLPKLTFEYSAVEPYIDAKTMEIHHSKHHQTYVDKLNAALQDHPEFANMDVTELLQKIDTVPESAKTAVRNHGGGHANHSLFWTIIGPQGSAQPAGTLAEKLNEAFGNFETFTEKFNQAATNQFGSGWAWLVVTPEKKLAVYSLPNQDSPYMTGDTPILGLDVWEHAYYLKYQNKRPEYISAFWSIVNWQEVERRYAAVAV